MGHGGQIRDDRFAGDILAENDRQSRVLHELFGGDKLAERHALAIGVGQFDADDGAARDGRDAGRERGHVAGDIVGKSNDAARLDAGRGLQFVHGDDRAGAHLDDVALHMEVVEDGFEQAGIALQSSLVDLLRLACGYRIKQVGRGQRAIAEQVILRNGRHLPLGGRGFGSLDGDWRLGLVRHRATGSDDAFSRFVIVILRVGSNAPAARESERRFGKVETR